MDNGSIQYINHQGGTHLSCLCALALELWQLAIENEMWLQAAHIKGEARCAVLGEESDSVDEVDALSEGSTDSVREVRQDEHRPVCLTAQQQLSPLSAYHLSRIENCLDFC